MMGALDQVLMMKTQGMSDEDIIRDLGERGVSPKDIDDALNQAQIKSAVSNIQGDEEDLPEHPDFTSRSQLDQNTQGYESYAQAPMETQSFQNPQEIQSYPLYPKQETPMNYNNDMNYSSYSYDQYGSNGYESNDFMEIANQIIEDKMILLRNEISSIIEFRRIVESQLENFENRITKIETIIDNLQLSILEKVGSYGQNLNTIRKEMEMMQDSFSKVIDPLTDKLSKKNN